MMHMLRARKGMTGLETAIILVAFVSTAAALSFVLLNMGFLSSQKTQTVIASSLEETITCLQVVDAVIEKFQLSADQTRVNMTTLEFYLRLTGGSDYIDLSDDKITMTYTNIRCQGIIFPPNSTVVTAFCVNGDDDTLLEQGGNIRGRHRLHCPHLGDGDADVSESRGSLPHPYETWQITLKPTQGGTLTIRRDLGAINRAVEALY